MPEDISELKEKALREIKDIDNVRDLESWRIRYLGRNGAITVILRGLGSLPLDQRKVVGEPVNATKLLLEAEFNAKKQALSEVQMAGRKKEAIDITLPGRPLPRGRLHPITQTLDEICDIFVSMGFQVVEGQEVETDYYNFEALNIPEEHPARDSMSTYWIDMKVEEGQRPLLLRTHNTAVSARVLESIKPPIRVIEPGKVYRYEASDATHLTMFHQIDGLVVDRGITMADLKGTLYEFARRFFGEERKVRFRCDYFPFVEPGVEIAIECGSCHGAGCRLCDNSGWIEILGAGMTHPQVLRRGGIDPEIYSSFAFGMGVDRLPMLRYGIDDMRLLFGNDLRFLKQF